MVVHANYMNLFGNMVEKKYKYMEAGINGKLQQIWVKIKIILIFSQW